MVELIFRSEMTNLSIFGESLGGMAERPILRPPGDRGDARVRDMMRSGFLSNRESRFLWPMLFIKPLTFWLTSMRFFDFSPFANPLYRSPTDDKIPSLLHNFDDFALNSLQVVEYLAMFSANPRKIIKSIPRNRSYDDLLSSQYT